MANNKGVKSTRSSGTVHTPRGVNQGTVLIDSNSGLPISVIEDVDGNKRIAVDARLTASNISVSVDLDFSEDSVHIGDPDTDNILAIEDDGSINANVEVDALDGDNIAISAHPIADQIFDESTGSLTADSFQQIYTYTSSDSATRILVVECTAETSCTFLLKINGVIKRQKRSSSLEKNVLFSFREHRNLPSGDTLTVEAKTEKFFSNKAPYATFTSLEGYLA